MEKDFRGRPYFFYIFPGIIALSFVKIHLTARQYRPETTVGGSQVGFQARPNNHPSVCPSVRLSVHPELLLLLFLLLAIRHSFSLSLTWVRIHQPFSRTFFVFVSNICKLECNTNSDWLNRMV